MPTERIRICELGIATELNNKADQGEIAVVVSLALLRYISQSCRHSPVPSSFSTLHHFKYHEEVRTCHSPKP
jgi:hypothetical protein